MSEFFDWISSHLWAGWGILALLLAAAELLTLDLTLLMLASGALMGGVTALIFPSMVWLQALVALATAVATLFLLRPTLLERVRRAPGYRSSLDNLIGSQTTNSVPITGSSGEVTIQGETWPARSYDPSMTIEAGESIEVLGIEGIVLLVYPTNRPLGR
ncbi:NfeD family protein [Tessaracoccus palaemonis]|uniref:NfeD family protein n=1 Tax=Tessaracoccus palaemonis TaxID=2829499 RepID=A0ABX8SIZ0_9ACTN|nr:NfeD family protein [Tessaracoccus palaemonis]QXT61948.1 NfeD family protein [Tessaracoccus palaemonis]